MWVCAILPKEHNDRIVSICKEANKGIGLPETVFFFPLHISMKKSFRVRDFERARCDVLQYMQEAGRLHCRIGPVVKHKNMIWLPVIESETINAWHIGLDQMLLEKHSVEIDEYDRDFKPHLSLFTKGSHDRMVRMMDALLGRIPETDVEFTRFVVGSSDHRDEYYDL